MGAASPTQDIGGSLRSCDADVTGMRQALRGRCAARPRHSYGLRALRRQQDAKGRALAEAALDFDPALVRLRHVFDDG